MRQHELDRVIADAAREIARQNAELRTALGDDEEQLERWQSVLAFAPAPPPAAGAPRWVGLTRA